MARQSMMDASVSSPVSAAALVQPRPERENDVEDHEQIVVRAAGAAGQRCDVPRPHLAARVDSWRRDRPPVPLDAGYTDLDLPIP